MVVQRLGTVAIVLLSCVAKGELSNPVIVAASGVPIDVERRGSAAPFFGDFDGDGKRDMLVGAYGHPDRCEMQVYLNVGKDTDPQFGVFVQFMEGKEAFRNTAFHPQLVDFDGDGMTDILTPSWPGQVRWFPRTETGFAKARLLEDLDGDPIHLDWIYSAYAVDWDRDGDMDVVAGVQVRGEQGNVCLLRNEGQVKVNRPEMLVADGKRMMLEDLTDIVVADWDGSGSVDLVVGRNNGSVVVYLNSALKGEPQFSVAKEILEAPAQDEDRGGAARVCVTDWNGDGKLDLLVGDAGAKFEKELDLDELDRKQRALDREKDAFAMWAEHYQMFRLLRAKKRVDAELTKRVLAVARKGMQDAKAAMESAWSEHQSIKPGEQRHGRVWLCLGK